MVPQLCKVCASIPEDFWAESYDLMEYCQIPFAKLQSLKQMRVAVAKGCQLCQILLKSPYLCRIGDENTTLYLRKSLGSPERAITLGVGPKGNTHISRTFFYRIPWWWWDLPVPLKGKLKGKVNPRPPYTVHKPTSSTDPVDNISLMKTWMRICQNHTKCSQNTTLFIPTRLLDVQAFGAGADVRLILSSSISRPIDVKKTQPSAPYLTLSHCWGPPEKHSVKTTKQNLASHMGRIPIANLSKTFADAIRITRELEFRYLWIDSLCIVQDDRDDWAKEAALMADVYGNAYCTLAALSSKDGTEGCNLVPNVDKTMGCSFFDLSIARDNSSHVRIFEKEPSDWATEFEETNEQRQQSRPVPNPLRFRAWTLQEDELSRRIIFFAKGQLLWKCCEQKATAQLPWVEKKPADPIGIIPWPSYDGVDRYTETGKYIGIRDEWYQLVEDYSLRSLTKDTDKLPAFAGLARKFQTVFPEAQYVAGMWGVHKPYTPVTHPNGLVSRPSVKNLSAFSCGTLLWRSLDKDAARFPEYIAPTWSWASIRGRVSYDSQRIEPSNMYERGGVSTKLSNCDFGCMHWEHMRAVPKDYDPYGAIKPGASLVLSGALLVHCHGVQPMQAPAHHIVGDRSRTHTRPTNTVVAPTKVPELPSWLETQENADGELLMKDDNAVGVFYRDTPSKDDAPQVGRTYCLRVRGESFYSIVRHQIKTENDKAMQDTAMCLILIKTSDGFRRIGMARWVTQSIFANIRPTTITLV